MTIAIATCSALPTGDEDAQLLRHALSAREVDATWCVWDDPSVDWGQFDLVVIRSTWDYTASPRPVSRLGRIGRPADQPGGRGRLEHRQELPARPGRRGRSDRADEWAAPGEPVVLPAQGEFVVKPSVGAGSKGAGRFDRR